MRYNKHKNLVKESHRISRWLKSLWELGDKEYGSWEDCLSDYVEPNENSLQLIKRIRREM